MGKESPTAHSSRRSTGGQNLIMEFPFVLLTDHGACAGGLLSISTFPQHGQRLVQRWRKGRWLITPELGRLHRFMIDSFHEDLSGNLCLSWKS